MPQKPHDELGASLTALLLGELPHDQAAALHQRLVQDPELAALYERLKHTVSLVRETFTTPTAQAAAPLLPLRMEERRRQKLLRQFKTGAPGELTQPRRRTTSWIIPAVCALGCVMIISALMLPTLSRAKAKAAYRVRNHSFNTWSLAKNEEAPAPSAPAEPDVMRLSLGQDGRPERGESGKARRPQSVTPLPSSRAAAKPAESAGAAIVLPKGGQPDDENRTARVTYSGQPEPDAARMKAFYDDSAGRSGGGGAGGGGMDRSYGGYGGVASGRPAKPAQDQPTAVAASDDLFAKRKDAITFGLSRNGDAQNLNYAWNFDTSKERKLAQAAGKQPPVLGDVPLLGNVVAGNRFYRQQGAVAGPKPATDTPQALGRLEEGVVLNFSDVERRLVERGAPASAGKPTELYARSSTEETPRLGLSGGRAKDELSAGTLKFKAENKAKDFVVADSEETGRQKLSSEGKTAMRHGLEEAAYSLNAVGYTPAPAIGLNSGKAPPTEAPRRAPSAVVLPSTEGDTSLALKDSNGADQKSRQYVEGKQQLEELQRFRQILDSKIASEGVDVALPKASMVEIVDRAQPASAPSTTLWDKLRGKQGNFSSSTRLKVEQDQSDIMGLSNRGSTVGYDPYFVQSETEVLQSEAVLGKVAENLDLKKAWAGKKGAGDALTTAETVQLLKNSLDVHPVPNTSLLEIRAKSDKPEEAAKIANAVAEVYRQRRQDQRKELSQGGIKALEEGRLQVEQKITRAQADVDRLQTQTTGQQIDLAPSKPAAIPQPEVQTSDNTFSTFSLNVSDVSFKLTGASLEKGVMPEPATVRSEEFINALDYRDPEPPPGVPVAFAWERAQYPFAQNRDLLRFSIKTAALGRQPGRPLNLVLLLDNSGSMERADRVRIIREALRVLAAQLQPQDKFSVVTFGRTARLWVDGVPGNQAAQATGEVAGLTPQGGTNLEDAMNLAYQTALRHYQANGVNRVVILTDGAANLGNVEPEALKAKVEANRKQGIALDCFGIGWEGYNDDLLEVLSRNGDGRYGFVNTPEEAATEFAGQLAGALHVAASDVKVQVEFNPARVTAYRQIGYAKHQLTKEQFRDNTVDAAEIGAAESGNALYVVEVNPRGSGPLATVRVRYKVPGTTDYREQEWPVPYTGNAVPLEQASPALRLATTASAFSEWLVSSPYAGEVTPDRLLGYLGGVPEVYGADARARKLEWMIRQAKSIAGK
ncbi:MAG: von Willebrand factor type A domain-containing protein [Verrucomicrobia bacterium]|nr:von Willebrand factor type A domain-containing protein [Verrucomicrobiota bacterium]